MIHPALPRRRSSRRPILALPLLIAAWSGAVGPDSSARAESSPTSDDGTSSAEILSTFELREGFRLELVAREPIVIDPVDIAWDERGVAWVVEMPGYPFPIRDADGKWPGRVVRLDDEDGDGVFDERTIFADDFAVASSLVAARGGIYLANPPDLTFLKDEDGDGRADVREAVLTGFSLGNTQHNFNGLSFGPDNWLHGANGGNSGKIRLPGEGSDTRPLYWRDFRFHPERRVFEPHGESAGGHGLAFDHAGRLFSTHNLIHVQMLVVPDRYLSGNPHLSLGDTMTPIADYREGRSSRIFPIGEPESRVNHPEESGYFSGSCGISHYGGGEFGEGFDGSLFVGDVVCNLVHRMRLRPEGSIFAASRPEGEERREFLASRDRAFRPVMTKTGPDGALWIVDFHRDVIEHPEWIPDEIEKNLDVRAGDAEGRIFRVVRADAPKRPASPAPSFDPSDPGSLVAALGDRNQWTRDTARRLLVERKPAEAVPALREALRAAEPVARMQALWTLQGAGALEDAEIEALLSDPDPAVRENALLAAEEREGWSEGISRRAFALGGDPEASVRLRAALVLGRRLPSFDSGRRAEWVFAVERFLKRDMGDRWIRLALETSADAWAADFFSLIVRTLSAGEVSDPEGARALHARVAETLGARKVRVEVRQAVVHLGALADPTGYEGALEGLVAGLSRGEPAEWMRTPDGMSASMLSNLGRSNDPDVLRATWRLADVLSVPADARRESVLEEAGRALADPELPVGRRLSALRLRGLAPFEARSEALFGLLDPLAPEPLRAEAMAQLAEGPNEVVAPRLIEVWKSLPPSTRSRAGDLLLHREANHDRLLTAFESGAIPLGQMNMDLERRRALLRAKKADTRERASKLFTDAGVVTRAEALARMRPALELAGDAARGREFFQANCAKCHAVAGEGKAVGPDLTEMFRKSKETLLHDILDPNAAVNPEHMSYAVARKSGDVVNGLLVGNDEAGVTLLAAEEERIFVPKDDVAELYSGGLSLMPEELESGFEPQAFADLLAFLQTPR